MGVAIFWAGVFLIAYAGVWVLWLPFRLFGWKPLSPAVISVLSVLAIFYGIYLTLA